jgi:hypothetical protein
MFVLKAGEVEDWAVGFGNRLKAGETLTGTPKVTVHSTTGPEAQYASVTVSEIARNMSSVTDKAGVVHAADEAVEFRITAANDAVEARYTLRAECGTTNGRSLVDPFPIALGGPPET